MIRGKIYKVTNKINGKAYIGQTTRTLDRRIKRHISDSRYDSYYFHRAIKKYGINNFTVEILEDDIPLNELDEKEIEWIEKYDTFKNGYNMTSGGDSLIDVIRKLSNEDVKEIVKLLKTTNLKEEDIAKLFDVSVYAISDINTGKSWHSKDIIYPIRKHEQQEVSYQIFVKIIKMLSSGLFSQTSIAKKFNLSGSVISHINTGKYKKYKYPAFYTFPICKNKVVSNGKLSIIDTLYLLQDYLSGDYKRKELAEKYNVSDAYVKGIISKHNKQFFENLTFPLKDNIERNKETVAYYIKLYISLS